MILKLNPEMLKNMTDDEIREYLLKNAGINNFAYVFRVCRNCGRFNVDKNTHTKDAKIVKVCRFCIDIIE